MYMHVFFLWDKKIKNFESKGDVFEYANNLFPKFFHVQLFLRDQPEKFVFVDTGKSLYEVHYIVVGMIGL